MSAIKTRTSRRAFFLKSGAVLGAGLGASAGAMATPASPSDAAQELARAMDVEAIRRLQLEFAALMEERRYADVRALFDVDGRIALGGLRASGAAAIDRCLDEEYRCQAADTFHCAYRQGSAQRRDEVILSEDGRSATATFHVDVLLGSPVKGDSTAAAMARLQGNVEDRRWESGRLRGRYAKTPAGWRVKSLEYLPA